MPDIRRKSTLPKRGRYLYRLYDRQTEQWYNKTSPYSLGWTKYEWRGRLFKRKSDLMNSLNHANLEYSSDRYVIVEYALERTNEDERVVVRESWYEETQREERERESTTPGVVPFYCF